MKTAKQLRKLLCFERSPPCQEKWIYKTFMCYIHMCDLYLTFIFDIGICHSHMTCSFRICIWHSSSTFISDIHILYLYLPFVFDNYIWLLYIARPWDPPRIFTGPKMWKTMCFIVFLPAKVFKMSVWRTLASKTLIKCGCFWLFAEKVAFLMRIPVVF